MRRFVLALGALLLSTAAQAQSIPPTCSTPNYFGGLFHAGCLAAADLNNSNTALTAGTATMGALKLSLTGGTLTGALGGTTGVFSGFLTTATPGVGTNSNVVATTNFVATSFAPLANPHFTGIPTGPTAAPGTNTTQFATTAFVNAFAGGVYAPVDSPALTGIPTAPTAAVDTNTTQLSTTAFVIGQAASSTPLMDGTAAVGTSMRWARGDHVHPTDSTRAAQNNANLTGVPTAPTATAGTSTTQLATTAFVATTYAPLASPALTGTPTAPTASLGTSTIQLATTAFVAGGFAPLASPSLTGLPTAPTATPGTSTTQLASTAFVAASFAPLASPALTGNPTAPTQSAGNSSTRLATTAFVATSFAPLASPTFTGTVTVPTPTAGDSTTKAASTAFVASSFAPLASPSFTGTVTSAGNVTLSGGAGSATISARNTTLIGQLTATGAPSASNSFLYAATTFLGNVNATKVAAWYLSHTDQVNYYGVNAVDGLRVEMVPTNNTVGGRNVIHANLNQSNASSAADDSTRHMVTLAGTVSSTVYNDGTEYFATVKTGRGALTGVYGQSVAKAGALAYQSVFGAEINAAIEVGASSVNRVGAKVSSGSTAAVRGSYVDAAFAVAEQSSDTHPIVNWATAFSIGSRDASYPLDVDSYVLRVLAKNYATYDPAIFFGGIDFREATITSGGFAFASTNFEVDETGAAFANGLTISGSGMLQAQTATVSGVTVANGGRYAGPAFPTWTVDASPSGPSDTATVTTATMGADIVVGFGNTGRNYTGGDSITAVGGTGTSPTWTATVDGSGRITALTLSGAGAWSVAPRNPVQLAGGTGSGAYINILTWTNTATFAPLTWEFAATGNGYSVNDVVTLVGDMGSAGAFTVTAVTSDGGIFFAGPPRAPGLTIQTVGSVTAIGGAGGYHSVTGGAGSGALLAVGYKVLTVTIVPGAGYLPKPPPTIRSSLTTMRLAELIAVMTPVAAPIKFGSGGWTANGSVATALTSVGPAGAHTTVQEWFTVTNASGVIRYIPAY